MGRYIESRNYFRSSNVLLEGGGVGERLDNYSRDTPRRAGLETDVPNLLHHVSKFTPRNKSGAICTRRPKTIDQNVANLGHKLDGDDQHWSKLVQLGPNLDKLSSIFVAGA